MKLRKFACFAQTNQGKYNSNIMLLNNFPTVFRLYLKPARSKLSKYTTGIEFREYFGDNNNVLKILTFLINFITNLTINQYLDGYFQVFVNKCNH